jgi:hypothetical protein
MEGGDYNTKAVSLNSFNTEGGDYEGVQSFFERR